MSWEHELAKKLKDRKDDGHYRDGCYLIGHVLSPHLDGSGELIISILDGEAMLTEEMVDRLSRGQHLREGMTVAVIPGKQALRGGQRYLVMEIPGHGDLLGRDGEDCHPIGAITGLRGELDNHNSRLVSIETVRLPDIEDRRLPDLENRRVPALEHDMNDSDGKVPVLTGRVAALETGKSDKGHTHQISEVSGLYDILDDLTPGGGGEANVIETVKVNGTALVPDANKAVDVPVPAKVSDLTNDSGFQTAAQVQTAAAAAVAGVLSEVSLFDLTPAVFVTNQTGISVNSGTTNLRTADLRYNYLSSEGHDLGGSTFRCLCLTTGRVTYSTTGSSFVLYKSDFKAVPAASDKKLLMTVRRFRENVGSSDSPPQIFAATYDANGKIWWAYLGTSTLGYNRQRQRLDDRVLTNGNLCIFVQFRKPTHTLQATFDLDIVAADAPVAASGDYVSFVDSGFTAQDQT